MMEASKKDTEDLGLNLNTPTGQSWNTLNEWMKLVLDYNPENNINIPKSISI